jgi:hypothetical protein
LKSKTVAVYVGLVHFPVLGKQGELITTSVTNLDIHDIARSCRTFGVKNYFLITPLKIQQDLVQRILGHWKKDESAFYNPDRQNALADARVIDSIEDAKRVVAKIEHCPVKVVVTGARFKSELQVAQMMQSVCVDKAAILLLFGTGHGLHQTVVESADYALAPILGSAHDGYNHLSVRSAAAIYLNEISQWQVKNLTKV